MDYVLCILVGGKQDDIPIIFGLSKTDVHNIFHCFLNTNNGVTDLACELLDTAYEWVKMKAGFQQKKSYCWLFRGWCCTIDVYFQLTTGPTTTTTTGSTVKDVGENVNLYYFVHFESYGLHCQAVCNADLWFLLFGIVGPGKTNSNVTFPRCDTLYDQFTNLPIGLYFFGDAAYTQSMNMLLILFTVSQRENINNNAYISYLSQL